MAEWIYNALHIIGLLTIVSWALVAVWLCYVMIQEWRHR